MTSTTLLPRWDMSVVYPGLESAEFQAGFTACVQGIEELEALFDDLGIGVERAPSPRSDLQALEQSLSALNRVQDSVQTLSAYISSFVTTDSRNGLAQQRLSELSERLVRLSQLWTRFARWVGSIDVESAVAGSSVLGEHAYLLQLQKESARHLMSAAEEDLAAELEPSGGTAWSRLQSNVSSQIMVPLDTGTGIQDVPMSVIRNLAMNPDRELRRRAYEAELEAWARHEVPLAAALNSIKGQSNVLESRRRWASPLDAAVFNNHIDRQTLDAMLQSAREYFPTFRRYLGLKARLLGVEKLAWFDIFAPLSGGERQWSYADATDFIVEQFASYSPRLSDFAAQAFRENWIDAEPRPGKRDGAFCMKLRAGESRVLTNFNPSYDAMSTLAHELGHAYHNYNQASKPPLLRTAPMTLAETASIFCQTLIKEAVLKNAGPAEQLTILEASLQDQCQVVVDISSRFLFEQRIYEARKRRDLSVEELKEMMLEAQDETYGEGLDSNLRHPYMWAAKIHYYSVSRPFYNYPYMFGQLFGLGLYSIYTREPDTFRAQYDDLLASTGHADAATLAAAFGFDIRSADFWQSSLELIRADVDRFEDLAATT